MITGYRNENLQKKMDSSCHICRIQCEQCHAMDSIQYYQQFGHEILRCPKYFSRHDQYDLHDNVYTFHLSGKLVSR